METYTRPDQLLQWLHAQTKRPTRDEMARRYACLIANCGGGADVKALNKAIERRWSASGLEAIKRRAWACVERYFVA